jgi:hypothetical protein
MGDLAGVVNWVLMESGDDSCEYNEEACELDRVWPTAKEASLRASSKENDGGVVGPNVNE